MSNIDNILGEEIGEIFLYDKSPDLIGGKVLRHGVTSSPLFLVGLFILAIFTFFFIYPESAKPFMSYRINMKEWLSDKVDQFFAYLHIDGQTIKKVIV